MIRAGLEGRPPGAADDRADRQDARLAPPISCGRRGSRCRRGAATGALADNAKNLPPNVADWTRTLGDGVGVRAYGNPSKYEKDVVRRTVPWLTATPESSVSFTPLHELDGIITPNGLCFERHHSGIAEIDPNDYRLMLHGLVDKPLIFTLEDFKRLPRVNRIHFLECAANSGMEWRGAQLNGVQYTHGMVHCVQYTGVPLKLLLEQAGLKSNAKWIMAEGGDAAAMNRSIPLAKGARRLHRRLSHERRNAASRAGLSGASRRAGLGRQCLGEVAAPHQGRRSALVHARGNLEIHRPVGERQGAQVHLRDGRQIGHHLAVAAGAVASKRASR